MPDYLSLFTALLALAGSAVVYFGTAGLKKILPTIPGWTVPFVAAGVTALVAYLANLAGVPGVNPYIAALALWGSSRIHEIWEAAKP